MKRLLIVLLVLLLSPVPLVLAGGDMLCAGELVVCADAASNDDSAGSGHARHSCPHCQANVIGNAITLPVQSSISMHLPVLAYGVLPNAPSPRPERPKWAPALRS